MKRAVLGLALLVGAASAVRAQTYEDIHDFEQAPPSARVPYGHLTLGPDGNFYGVSLFGGSNNCPLGCGTVFRLESSGDATTIHEFAGGDLGQHPGGDLLLASDGNFYGTTGGDGDFVSCPGTCGTVYRIETNGDFAVIHNFDTAGGFGPNDALIEPQPGVLWGTTIVGPASGCAEDYSCGTVFRMDFAGGLETMHTFTAEEGHHPFGPLVLAADGNLYGATSTGGSKAPDGIFRITQNGDYTPIFEFTFDCHDVRDGLLSVGGDLVGACQTPTGSLIFRLTTGGSLQEIHPFAASGVEGVGALKPMLASDGLLYGVALQGGAHDRGTIWQLDLNGAFTKLHDFEEATGSIPAYGLTQSPDGTFYGSTPSGGANLEGVLYRLTMPGLTRLYCPNAFVRRDQMAVFLLKIAHGADYIPPPCTGQFGDVACPGLFADWIEQLAAEGVTAGCGNGNFCPLTPVSRAQMAVFLLKTEHGSAYTPNTCTGTFPDVPCPSLFADWIEQLATEGITGGCGGNNYCPGLPVTRAQMAVFLLKLEHGGGYVPPDCGPTFADVVCPSLFAAWVEQLFEERITAGCAGPSP